MVSRQVLYVITSEIGTFQDGLDVGDGNLGWWQVAVVRFKTGRELKYVTGEPGALAITILGQ